MIEKTIEILTVDVPNKNGRIYPKQVVEEAIKKCNYERFGTIGVQSDFPWPNLFDVACNIKNLRIEDSKLIGDMQTLTTPKGLMMESLMNETELGFVVCGLGDVSETGEVSNFSLTSVSVIPAPLVA